MPIVAQLIQIPFVGGMDEKTHPQITATPTLIQNRRYAKSGSLGRRPGSAALTTTGYQNARSNYSYRDATAPTLLAQCRNELVRVGGGALDRVHAIDSTHSLIYRDRVSECLVTRKEIAAGVAGSVGTPGTLDLAYDGTYVVALFFGQPGLCAAVFDAATLELLGAPVVLPTSSISNVARVMLIGGVAYVLYQDASGYIAAVTVAPITQAVSGATRLSSTTAHTASGATGGAWDACTDGTNIFFAYASASSGSNAITLQRQLTDLVTNTTTTFGGTDPTPTQIAIHAETRVHVGYDQTSTNKWRGAAFDTTTIATGYWGPEDLCDVQTALRPGIVEVTSSGAIWTVGFGNASTQVVLTDNAGGITSNVGGSVLGTMPISRPFRVFWGGALYWYVALQTSDANGDPTASAAIVEIPLSSSAGYPFCLVATYAVDEMIDSLDALGMAPSVPTKGSGVALIPTQTGFLSSLTYTLHIASARFNVSTSCVDMLGDFVLSGGVPMAYDGNSCREFGFLYPPRNLASSTGTGGISAGTYFYKAIFRETDARGQVHYSSPSSALQVVLAASHSVTVSITNFNLTNRLHKGFACVDLYRTTNGGSTYYYVGSSAIGGSSGTVSVVDNVVDPSANPIIYTDDSDGQPLASETPPSAAHIGFALNRLWLSGTDDGYLWPSQPLALGQPAPAPQFSSALAIAQFAPEQVDAVVGMDDKAIAFTAGSIWFTFGAGPSPNGTGSFAAFQRISSEYGCVDVTSIAVTVDGVWFRSATGQCLLDRGLQVHTIGTPVEDSSGATEATPWGVSAAVVVSPSQEVRFSVRGSGDARTLVYDTQHGTPQQPVWYRYLYDPPNGGPEIAAACMFNGLYTWITTDGYVYQETPGVFYDTDDGTTKNWPADIVDLAPFKTSDLQGFLRCWRVGVAYEKKSDCDITLTIYADNDPAPMQSPTFLASTSTAWTDQRVMARLKKQRVRSVKLRITTSAPTGESIGTGEGFVLLSAAIEFQQQGGMRPIPAAQKA